MATRAVSTVVTYRAWDASANAYKTGDVANHTLRWIKDGTSSAPTNTPTEVDATNAKGVYKLTLTSTETDCTFGVLAGISSTANISIFGVQVGFEYIPNAVAGASGGLLISGSNAGTTTLAALTVTGATTLTGNVSAAAGVNITQSTSNASALVITGNGTGSGINTTGGATGHGVVSTGGATSGIGIFTQAGGSGQGIYALGVGGTKQGIFADGGSSAAGIEGRGGSTAGNGITATARGTGIGISVVTANGAGISVTPTAGDALVLTANGTSKHGLVATGGTAGTSDGIKAVAGTGGVAIRGDITGNVTGNLSGSVGSVAGLTVANLDVAVSSRMATYVQPTGFLAATFDTGTVANTTNITAGTITTATNLTNAPTNGDFTAVMKTSLNAATPASVTGAVGSVTGNIGGTLANLAAGAKTDVENAVWDATTATHTVAGSFGASIMKYLRNIFSVSA